METRKLCECLSILSSEKRLKIVGLLRGRNLCAGAIAHRLGVSPSVASQHLRILRTSGMVKDIKSGYFVHYQLNEAAMVQMLEDLTKRLVLNRTDPKSIPHNPVLEEKAGKQRE